MGIFSEWEKITGKHPTEEVRRLGIHIRKAYLRNVGAPQKIIDLADKDSDPERRHMWDDIAQATLDYQASEPTGKESTMLLFDTNDTESLIDLLLDYRDAIKGDGEVNEIAQRVTEFVEARVVRAGLLEKDTK